MSDRLQPGQDLGFDPDALREKYRQERDRRIRPDGNDQYQKIAGEFGHFDQDPYVERVEREPLSDETDILIIGGGFAGILTAARFREAGFDNLRIIEKGGDFGGTWYWNRYPGCQCDIESYSYLPLLEELGYMPKEKYSYAPEIFEHSQRVAKAYDLYAAACLQTEVKDLRWDPESARWIVSTDRDDRMKARFVVVCSGFLSRPKLPGIPGIGDFEGHSFHTSRWDYEYTGGNHGGNLHKLADKRVGIIGTGCTSIQSVPYLGETAKKLYVFQRTPSSVDLRGNAPTDPDWVKTLTPGWQKRRRENFNDVMTGVEVEEDLVNDGWTGLARTVAGLFPRQGKAPDVDPAERAYQIELADFAKMNQVRARVDSLVDDPATAEALKPWYRQFCKRPTFNDDYLPTFNRPNVELVDTSGGGVERITRKGVVVDGVEYEVDLLIFATGFEVGTAYTRRANLEIHGHEKTLTEHWHSGMRTLHGYGSHGFPNLFHVGVLQNGVSVNYSSMVDEQAGHIAYIIDQVNQRGASSFEVSAQSEEEWVATIDRLAGGSKAFFEACTPGYYNNEGRPGRGNGLTDQQYTPGINAFNRLLEEWRSKGDLEGLELS